MKAHVICCNDSVEAVVLEDEEQAKLELACLAQEDYVKHGWESPTYKQYRNQYYWHIHTVEVVDV